MNQPSPFSRGFARYLLFVLGVGLLAMVGYAGYVVYPRFNLPAGSGAVLLPLAAMAGVASFFSPCSFPLLLTLLARATSAESKRRQFLPAMRFAAALSVGATVFLLLAGAALALGAGAFFAVVTFTSPPGRLIRAVAGITLILLGLVQLGKLPNSFDQTWRVVAPLLKTQARMRKSNPTLAFGLYGFGYILAGFGWTGPILAGLAGHALTAGGPGTALFAFLTAAASMVVLFFMMATLVAFARERALAVLRDQTVRVKRWGGLVLVGVGGWLLALATWADALAGLFPV